MRIGAIVAAGGNSQRFGSDKLAMVLSNRSVLEWSQKAVLEIDKVEKCVTVCSDLDNYKKLGIKSDYMTYEKGGPTREESVRNGLQHFTDFDVVLVHDGARPFVSRRIIEDLIDNANLAACVIPIVPCTSAVKSSEMGFISDHVSGKFVLAQTPQLVWVKPLLYAMDKNKGSLGSFPDESSLVSSVGLHVKAIPGSSVNIKITSPDDEMMAKALASVLFNSAKQQKGAVQL